MWAGLFCIFGAGCLRILQSPPSFLAARVRCSPVRNLAQLEIKEGVSFSLLYSKISRLLLSFAISFRIFLLLVFIALIYIREISSQFNSGLNWSIYRRQCELWEQASRGGLMERPCTLENDLGCWVDFLPVWMYSHFLVKGKKQDEGYISEHALLHLGLF